MCALSYWRMKDLSATVDVSIHVETRHGNAVVAIVGKNTKWESISFRGSLPWTMIVYTCLPSLEDVFTFLNMLFVLCHS